MSFFVHLWLLSRLWVWCPGMWCRSSCARDCIPGARTHKHGPGSPLANSHFILTVRPAVLFMLSVATHPCSWSSSLGEKSWLAHLLFKPVTYTWPWGLKDCHLTPVKFFLSFERDTDRGTDSLLVWFRLSGRGRSVGWKIMLTKNNIPPFFAF